MRNGAHLVLALSLIGWMAASASAADDADKLPSYPEADTLKLVQAGLGEEVLLAWVDSLPPYARLTTDAIVKLMEKKVSEKVIAALVRRGGKRAEEVKELSRYRVPVTASTRRASEYVKKEDYERDKARREYRAEDAVRYSYRQPTTYVSYYDTSPYYYSSSFYLGYYPYYRYSCYPYYRYHRYGHYGHHHHRYHSHRGHRHYRNYRSHGYIGRSHGKRVGARRR